MSRWAAAHRIAQIAAQNARGDAELRHDQRADVIAMIDTAGVEVFGQHSSRLFGATIPAEGDRPLTIWLNANSTVTGQRHTAAHEWGHRVLDHPATCEIRIGSIADDAQTERGTTADPTLRGVRTLPETTAEAFAAWLLMPRGALRSALRALGVTTTVTPQACYATSLLLGTSYSGTARHLHTAHLLDRDTSAALMRVAPGRIKAGLDVTGAPPRDPRANIWRLADVVGFDELVFADGDRIVVDNDKECAALGDQLLDQGLAEFVWQSPTYTVLAATTVNSGRGNAAYLRHASGDVMVRVDHVLQGLSDPSTVLDVSAMTPEEVDALYATQEQIFRDVQGERS